MHDYIAITLFLIKDNFLKNSLKCCMFYRKLFGYRAIFHDYIDQKLICHHLVAN